MSNDGQQLVYLTGPNKPQLYLRGTQSTGRSPDPRHGSDAPFFSPDGQWVGFFADGKLQKVALRGGAPITLADVRGQGGSRTTRVVFGGSFGF